MAVRLRLKRLGRKHRPFFRVCAMDSRAPRDGKVLEELGYYDPMVRETDARAVLDGERIDYWLGVGAQPTEKVSVLIKKYGKNGTHLTVQQEAMERLKTNKPKAPPPRPVPMPKPAAESQTDEGASEESSAESSAEQQPEASAEATTADESGQ